MPCVRTDVRCDQGMVLEVDHVGPRGGPLKQPRRYYRCQDCGEVLLVYTGPLRNGAPVRRIVPR